MCPTEYFLVYKLCFMHASKLTAVALILGGHDTRDNSDGIYIYNYMYTFLTVVTSIIFLIVAQHCGELQ